MRAVVFLGTLIWASNCLAWGIKGQQITVRVAEQFLSANAKMRIQDLTGGKPLESFASWADTIRGNPQWRATGVWHYINIEDPAQYSHELEAEPNDIVDAIDYCVGQYKAARNNEDKLTWLKFLIHLVGDVHQPLHVGSPSDRGGNQVQVQFGRMINLHSLWDSSFIESRGLSVVEYTNMLFKERRSTSELGQAFNINKIVQENLKNRAFVYSFKNNTIDKDYQKIAEQMVADRLWNGGVRLSNLLNSILR